MAKAKQTTHINANDKIAAEDAKKQYEEKIQKLVAEGLATANEAAELVAKLKSIKVQLIAHFESTKSKKYIGKEAVATLKNSSNYSIKPHQYAELEKIFGKEILDLAIPKEYSVEAKLKQILNDADNPNITAIRDNVSIRESKTVEFTALKKK